MAKERKLSQGFEDALKTAFPIAPTPTQITSSTTPDCREIESLLQGHRWNDIPGHLVDRLQTDLPLLSSEYFRYVLPAYLARAYKTEDRSLAFHTTSALQPGSVHAGTFGAFSSAQRAMIKRFLEWAANRLGDPDAEKTSETW